MKIKKNRLIKIILTVFIFGMAFYGIWYISQPVKIMGIFRSSSTIYIVVDHFPLTANGRIQWWKSNDARIKQKYKIPLIDDEYNVTVWDIGDGFEVRNDRQSKFMDFKSNEQFCFEQDVGEEKCIQKDILLRVSHSFDRRVNYYTKNTRYRENTKGELVEYE